MRLLLALRYALEPAHVDRAAVEGVIGAYVGLAAIPGLVLLFARVAFLNVQRSPDNRGPRLHVLGFIGAWPVAIGLTLLLAGNLWPSWPVNGLRFAIAIGLAAGLGAILCGMLDYSATSNEQMVCSNPSRMVQTDCERIGTPVGADLRRGKGIGAADSRNGRPNLHLFDSRSCSCLWHYARGIGGNPNPTGVYLATGVVLAYRPGARGRQARSS